MPPVKYRKSCCQKECTCSGPDLLQTSLNTQGMNADPWATTSNRVSACSRADSSPVHYDDTPSHGDALPNASLCPLRRRFRNNAADDDSCDDEIHASHHTCCPCHPRAGAPSNRRYPTVDVAPNVDKWGPTSSCTQRPTLPYGGGPQRWPQHDAETQTWKMNSAHTNAGKPSRDLC